MLLFNLFLNPTPQHSKSKHKTPTMDDNFIKQVHDLPPELFNQIRDEVFKPPTTKVITVNSSFKFPVQLHINRADRKAFRKKYLANAIIKIQSADIFSKFCSILEALDASYRETIRCFTVPYQAELEAEMHNFTGDLKYQDLSFWLAEGEEFGPSMKGFWVCRRKGVDIEELLDEL